MKKTIFFVLTGILLLFSCSNAMNAELMLQQEKSDQMQRASGFGSTVLAVDEELVMDSDRPGDSLRNSELQEQTERKLVRTGYLILRSSEFSEAAAELEQMVAGLDGYVEDFYETEYLVRLVCRIPAEQFEAFFSLAGDFGETVHQNRNVRDVTLDFYDTKSRLEAKEIMRERLEDYLRTAENIKDLLEIERELSEINGEIDRIATRFKVLSQQISYSTITVEIQNSESPVPENQLPSWRRGFLKVGRNILGFLYWVVFVLIYVVLFGVPVVIISALLWWITFGRIGWVKKLFKKISGKRTVHK